MYLPDTHKIWLATGETPIYLEPGMANRHGLIAGATGTGKTVTLKVLAESFSDMGVPVFLADIKGDLSGMCAAGAENKHIRRSIDTMGLGNLIKHLSGITGKAVAHAQHTQALAVPLGVIKHLGGCLGRRLGSRLGGGFRRFAAGAKADGDVDAA